MTYHRFLLESRTWLRIISWKTLLACIAGIILAPTIAHADVPVAVPLASPSVLAGMRDANIRWAAFRLIALAIPLFFLFTGLGARLRRWCESVSGRRWFWTATFFVCAYLFLAALTALPLTIMSASSSRMPLARRTRACLMCSGATARNLPLAWSSHHCSSGFPID